MRTQQKAASHRPDCTGVYPADEKIVESSRLSRCRRLMTCLLLAVPFLGAVVAAAWTFFRPVGATEVSLLVGMWLLTSGLGTGAGYHRLLTHRTFKSPAAVRLFLASAGAMAFQGPPLYWAALHRRHHELSDGPGDPHSPAPNRAGLLVRARRLWHAHAGWMLDHPVPNTLHYVPDLLKDRAVLWVNRHYLPIALAGLLLPAAAAGLVYLSWEGALAGLLWGGLVRLFFASHATWSVNSVCHAVGSRAYETSDNSRNVALLAIPTFGESWHNNHHAFPASARMGLRWWQLDLAYLMIRCMACLGLASEVRVSDARGQACRCENGDRDAERR